MKLSSLGILTVTTALLAALSVPLPVAVAKDPDDYRLIRMTATFNSPFGNIRRDALSAEQKRALRAYGREMCIERLKSVGPGHIRNIAILSDGRVRCFYAS